MTGQPRHGLETITATTWLSQLLSADVPLAAAIGVPVADLWTQLGEGLASEATEEVPWVTWTLEPALDVKVVGGIQVMARVRFQIKATCRDTGYGPVIPVYDRVHTLLEGAAHRSLAAEDGFILTVTRVSGVQYPETTEGTQYRHLGGLYEAFIQ